MERPNRSILSRRKFLLAAIGTGTAAILMACQGPAQPGTGSTPVAANTPAAGKTPAPGTTPAAGSTPKPTLEIPAATPTPAPTPEISTEIPPSAFPDIKYDNVPKLAYKGTIQFWPQAYLPTKPQGTTTKTPQYLNRIVYDYQQLHPDIKISLERGPAAGTDSTTWTRTKAAGGQLMDITWQQAGTVNNDYPKGFFVDLTPYYNKPNPYIQKGQPGSVKWIDSIPGFVVDQAIRAPDGKMYQVNCDYVGTALFYNKDLFSASGVDPEKPPETWEEFMTALKKLKDTGKDNFTAQTFEMGTSNMWWSWYHRVAYTQLYADEFDKLNVDKQPFRLSNLAEAVAFINKDYDPSSERYQDAWRLFKDWSQYWDPGFLSGPDSYRAWVNSKTAIYWNGSWQIPQMLTNTTIKFKWGSFPIPSFTPTTSKFVQKGTKAPMVGGPSAAFQYSIATPQADQTMTQDKIDACVDWLMFLAAPQNSGPMVNDLGSFLPTVAGTKPLESLAPLISSMQNTEKQGGACELNSEEGDAYYRLIQEFMANRTSLGDTMQKVTPVIQAAIDKQARENKWDLSKYKR